MVNLSEVPEKYWCVRCPKVGRTGIWRNLKAAGMSYCRVCYREYQRDQYQLRKYREAEIDVEGIEATLARVREEEEYFDDLIEKYEPPPV
jgi:hypothetical protein